MNDDDRPAWAIRLRAERRERGWSQRELAKALAHAADHRTRAGLPARESVIRRIKDWEAGNHQPRDPYRLLYCRVFAVPEGNLFGCRGATAVPGKDGGSDPARSRMTPSLMAGLPAAPGNSGSVSTVWPTRNLCEQVAPYAHDPGEPTSRVAALPVPAGRFFAGSAIPLAVYRASDIDRLAVAIDLDSPQGLGGFGSQRSLLVATVESNDKLKAFGVDLRHGQDALPGSSPYRTLLPRAYELDDLTLGLLCAVQNYDESLLSDDSSLMQSRNRAGKDIQFSASKELGASLTAVSRMWLGSQFCADHITHNLVQFDQVPTFWTCERRGEEASSWLFFSHKYSYLHEVLGVYAGGDEPPSRAFCIPPGSVTDSSRPERILLFLAVVLVESFGIRVDLCVEPDYASVEGFVLDHRRRAIVANWVGDADIWSIDVTDSRSHLTAFIEVAGHARAHSVISSSTSLGRIQSLADYLDLDLPWLTRRCAELAVYGVSGLVRPRSRLLGTEGVDRACRYLSRLHVANPKV
jgi:transcriptional regulator with XRE-family HTH domain